MEEANMKLSVKDYLKQGEASISKGDFDPAITSFTNALELDPTQAVAYRGRAFSYIKKVNSIWL